MRYIKGGGSGPTDISATVFSPVQRRLGKRGKKKKPPVKVRCRPIDPVAKNEGTGVRGIHRSISCKNLGGRDSQESENDVGIDCVDANCDGGEQHWKGSPEEGHRHPPSPILQAQGERIPFFQNFFFS